MIDLVPLLSQVLLRARCRYCGTKISWRYFWVEMLTGLAFTALYFRFGPAGRWAELIAACLFTAVLIVIFFIDLEHYIIPDIAVYIGVAVGIAKDLWLIHEGSRSLWRTVERSARSSSGALARRRYSVGAWQRTVIP